MPRISSYLTFNGNCREAMSFYQDCLGGELFFQTLGESPASDRMPPSMHKFIVQASLRRDELLLVGSDLSEDKGLIPGNSVSLLLHCQDPEELTKLYNRLSEKGEATQLPEVNEQGALMGGLTDQFGIHWLLWWLKGYDYVSK